ncbi:MAG: DUF3303 family protein [Chloracidobacterium sp.]|nr:DUF3303 family protein [Chloracidobacterium sp.]
MIIENFKTQDPVPVYRRIRDCSRLAPEGLQYVSSRIDEELNRCFQMMESDDSKLLEEWNSNWSDIPGHLIEGGCGERNAAPLKHP